MKESFPLYRHHKLYSQFQDFKKAKFVDKNDWKKYVALKNKLNSLMRKGSNEMFLDDDKKFEDPTKSFHEFEAESPEMCDEEAVEPADNDQLVDYSHRYDWIAHKGYLYNNIRYVDAILYGCTSYSQFKMKCALKGIDDRDMRFAVCCMILNIHHKYTWYDFGKLGKKTLERIAECIQRGATSKLDEFVRFQILVEGYEEACKKGNEVRRFEDFASKPLYST